MEKVNWIVEGMTCSNCALTIHKFLEKKGLENIRLSLAGGDLSFDLNGHTTQDEIKKGISDLGYHVVNPAVRGESLSGTKMNKHLLYLLICVPFTALLMLHMLNSRLHWDWLMNPWVQLTLCLPVYITGMNFFGRSAIQSIRNGMPNMNVLVALGATAAFTYSLVGTVLKLGEAYLFYETAAAIISFVLFGNYLEDVSVQSTQKELNKLARSQKVMANMIAFDEHHQETIFPVENVDLRSGDLLLIKSGEWVPADCKILWGDASVNEAIITGESLPLLKKPKDHLIGGSILSDGMVKAQVTAAYKDSVLSNIINLVKQAQGEKPPLQQLADKISAVFVPVVLSLALLTFLLNYVYLHDLTASLMRSIAVLVIACPCAMGLATPAAIAVGLGRAAKHGILFRHAKSLELFKDIRQVVFDKTGTLTTGAFAISNWQLADLGISPEEFKRIAYSLEKYSNHPIAKSIAREWKTKEELKWKKIEEEKGLGMKAVSVNGDRYWAGSRKLAGDAGLDGGHNVYIGKNDLLLGWIDVKDEIRPGAAAVIQWIHAKNIRTILLSGDLQQNCLPLAEALQIDEVISEQSPEQKLARIAAFHAEMPTAMVGDGINDAPALAKATIGISMSDASHIAMQTSDVVLMNRGLENLPMALSLGRKTYETIRQNLFWAFFYNIIAIPIAAFGLLTPGLAALAMGLSDVVLLFNSIRLFVRKL
jgi:Cu+-exporting ATPase